MVDLKNARGMTVPVTTTARKILPFSKGRRGLILQKLGSYDIWISFDDNVAVDEGIKLSASMGFSRDFCVLSLWAVADGGTSNMRVEERF